MTTEQLRTLVVSGIDGAQGHFLFWATLSSDQRKCLLAMREYWQADSGSQLQKLLDLFNKEPSMPVRTASSILADLEALANDVLAGDWPTAYADLVRLLGDIASQCPCPCPCTRPAGDLASLAGQLRGQASAMRGATAIDWSKLIGIVVAILEQLLPILFPTK